MTPPEAVLVLPRLRIQNANAISSPLTHGFPSMTAFTGLMWALQRKLACRGVVLRLHGVGVVCHHHQEQVTQGHVRSFNLARHPVCKDGRTAALVEEGRMHLQITLVLAVSRQPGHGTGQPLAQCDQAQLAEWARIAGETLEGMRVAGGSVLPSRPMPGWRVRPWMAIVPRSPQSAQEQFRQWRRQWLPGLALVGRDGLLGARLQRLRLSQPDASLLDAWLHASRFNLQPVPADSGTARPAGKVAWSDPLRERDGVRVVPIPVGYAALTPYAHAPGSVRNARDARAALQFVESVYSLGEWVSPDRLDSLEQLLWHAETDKAKGLYRCRNGQRSPAAAAMAPGTHAVAQPGGDGSAAPATNSQGTTP